MAKRPKPTNGKHKPTTAVQRLAHKTKVRFTAMERVIGSGFSELGGRIDAVGTRVEQLGERLDRQSEFLKLIATNTRDNNEQTALLRQIAAQATRAGNLEPRVAKCEAEIEELKKKPSDQN
jgi:hypothetical protein